MKKINYAITEAGSESGLSYYRGFLQCPRKATMRKLNKMELTPEEQVLQCQGYALGNTYDPKKKSASNVGTLGHVLMDLFFSKDLTEPKTIEWTHPINDTDWAEACRCFEAWREFVGSNNCLGRVVETEFNLPHGRLKKKPARGNGKTNWEKREEQVCSAVGISPFTGRLDLLVCLTKTDIHRIVKTWGTSLVGEEDLQPGFWIVDHKFFAREMAWTYEEALESMQYTAYPLAWNAVYKTLESGSGTARRYKPVMGTLQNTIFKTSQPKFRLYVVPFPSSRKVQRLHTTLANIAEIIGDEARQMQCNDNWCRHPFYGSECEFKVNRQCKGF